MTETDVKALKSLESTAPKSLELEAFDFAGAYFRSFLDAGRAAVCEVAYHALRPGAECEVLTIEIAEECNKPQGWEGTNVYHGTSLAGARAIIQTGFLVGFGAWRQANCMAIEKLHGQLPAVYTSPYYHTSAAYMGNVSADQKLASGPHVRAVLECWSHRRMARIAGKKKQSWSYSKRAMAISP